MSRIAPVYTLPQHRGRGYGSAVTAAAAGWAQQAGAAQVVLFTDLAVRAERLGSWGGCSAAGGPAF
ncbi:MAG: GNAT family N-acetyltransferase [Pseudonocardiaceae bacterium]